MFLGSTEMLSNSIRMTEYVTANDVHAAVCPKPEWY